MGGGELATTLAFLQLLLLLHSSVSTRLVMSNQLSPEVSPFAHIHENDPLRVDHLLEWSGLFGKPLGILAGQIG